MGQEIQSGRFNKHDFELFARHLRDETELLGRWFGEGRLSHQHGVGGFELEAWLVDEYGRPAPVNREFMDLANDALVSPELSLFNIELNSTPQMVAGDALRVMHRELQANWARCGRVAERLGAQLVMIGILPTIAEQMLTLENMSHMQRYRALNEQVLRLRGGRPLSLDIQGAEHLRTEHGDVMLEAATTSFQIHLQVALEKAVRYFNTMVILSAPMVAATTNSPLLFGRHLWRETRIPLFEQAVSVGGFAGAAFGPVRRVTFGTGYARRSLMEFFRENLEHYPLLLPVALEEGAERLAHLRLHNGTIWRWNRPLIGFDADGGPHLRIEHRVVPAGPTVLDSIANAALFFGLAPMLAEQAEPPESLLDFARARENFYAAAKHGLQAQVTWLDGRHGSMCELLREDLLPLARRGLARLGCDPADIDLYLGVIEGRLANGQTGAQWQLDYRTIHGADLEGLVAAYRLRQESGAPVHEWSL
jgi:hypothetical protein